MYQSLVITSVPWSGGKGFNFLYTKNLSQILIKFVSTSKQINKI